MLLPPSETKRPGGGSAVVNATNLSQPELSQARERVMAALVLLSQDEETAAKALKLGPTQRAAIVGNRELRSAPTLPAMERYTGVLYDALDVVSLGGDERAWLSGHVAVQSALFGLISAGDPIPSYRLSASSALPGLTLGAKKASLKSFWKAQHADIPWDAAAFTLDLRSQDYVALNPIPVTHPSAFVTVSGRDATGAVRPLNHFNKAAKGLLVRELSQLRPAIHSAAEFVSWAREQGHNAEVQEGGGIEFVAGPG